VSIYNQNTVGENGDFQRLYAKISRKRSVGIDLKELGGQLPKCLKFCQGIGI